MSERDGSPPWVVGGGAMVWFAGMPFGNDKNKEGLR
jgi:hypothetical protein